MTYEVISPVDGSVYYTGTLQSMIDVNTVLDTAKKAEKEWASTPLEVRRALVESMSKNIVEMREEIGEEISWQMGRPVGQAKNEPLGFEERAMYLSSVADSALDIVRPEQEENFDLYMSKNPLGTVAILSPWNYPFLTASNVIASALLAGNTVVLKHSLQTPLVAERIKSACEKAGFPMGVFDILHISHEDTAKMIGDKRIDGVFFTGSVEGGRKVQEALSHKFVPCGLELGGKDSAYVTASADVDFAVENLVDGAFFNSGQSCCGIERIYVHDSLYDEFITKYVNLTKQYKLGNPFDSETNIGPMVKTSSADFVREQIKDAIAKGATSLVDESLFPASQEGTAYLSPHVLVDVNHDMSIMRDESFGPVVGIMKVSSDAQAIALMNDSDFGLTASVWTEDIDGAYGVCDQIEAGTVFVNRCDYLHPKLAWTGVKNTGRGISLSKMGFDQVTRIKSYHIRTKR